MKLFRLTLLLIITPLIFAACNTAESKPELSNSPVLERIATRGELIVGTAASMPPLNMTTKSGDIIGIEPDIANFIAASMGVDLKLKAMSFHQLLPALEAGEIDMVMSNMTITGKRNLKVAFVGPYFISGKSILTKDIAIASIKNGAELNTPETTLAALKGSTSQQVVEGLLPKAKLIPTETYDDAVKLVLDGKVNALVADYPICLISTFRYPEAELSTMLKPFTFEPIGIAVTADDPLLINWLQNFFTSFNGSGELERTTQRWLDNGSWLDLLPKVE
ncbi:MAG: transporter substrate-binding domain-containing protein [Deltaproteobacteria bacterium]|nr:transporter substrate-binding domain-containing protein [Candidatus Tharpella sp.]